MIKSLQIWFSAGRDQCGRRSGSSAANMHQCSNIVMGLTEGEVMEEFGTMGR